MRSGTAIGLLLGGAWAVGLSGAWSASAQGTDPKTELPDGEGKNILLRACTTCHELGEVTKFRTYYTREDWRDVVVTMVKYGAELKEGETDTLVDYLGQHLSRKER